MYKSKFIIIMFLFLTSAMFVNAQRRNIDDVRNRIAENLNLTQEQKDKIGELITAHQRVMVDLRADLKKLQIDKKELFRSKDYNRSNRLALEERILEQQKKIRLSIANHQMDIYELLSDEQKAQWKEGRNRITQRMGIRKDRRMKLLEKRRR